MLALIGRKNRMFTRKDDHKPSTRISIYAREKRGRTAVPAAGVVLSLVILYYFEN